MNVLGFFVALTMVAALLGGCCGRGGGTTKVESTTKATTTGQELTDLKKAFDSGAITEDQYNKMKQEILDK
jgi:uncharacterized membrane protein